ncbi:MULTISPECIES: LysR substrate-binding domain-containing protein [unclassified Pseudomonas]|uniref:LysR substrate-binding domain-containing protein n=2 Tax=unclassified Pseudomonas TaxID=196821 RepID=UPI001DA943D6|nr:MULTISPECIES: LysR substrate-binding domain-containing protein [unclassified Pseudomonas]MBS6036136.1 hypothetical protein [Pseudomonas sp.]
MMMSMWSFVEPLLEEAFFPACAPTYNGGRLPNSVEQLTQATLLRNDYSMWNDWFAQAGLPGQPEPCRGVLYQDASQQLQATVDGQGIGLVRRSLAMQEILSGNLVRLFEVDVVSSLQYWFVCPEPLHNSYRVRVLRQWLQEEVRLFRSNFESAGA